MAIPRSSASNTANRRKSRGPLGEGRGRIQGAEHGVLAPVRGRAAPLRACPGRRRRRRRRRCKIRSNAAAKLSPRRIAPKSRSSAQVTQIRTACTRFRPITATLRGTSTNTQGGIPKSSAVLSALAKAEEFHIYSLCTPLYMWCVIVQPLHRPWTCSHPLRPWRPPNWSVPVVDSCVQSTSANAGATLCTRCAVREEPLRDVSI